jgi:hypothetical protein
MLGTELAADWLVLLLAVLPLVLLVLVLLLQAERASAATAATDSALARNFCRFTYPPQTLDVTLDIGETSWG